MISSPFLNRTAFVYPSVLRLRQRIRQFGPVYRQQKQHGNEAKAREDVQIKLWEMHGLDRVLKQGPQDHRYPQGRDRFYGRNRGQGNPLLARVEGFADHAAHEGHHEPAKDVEHADAEEGKRGRDEGLGQIHPTEGKGGQNHHVQLLHSGPAWPFEKQVVEDQF